MKVELIVPVISLHGKLSGKSTFYFRTCRGRTFFQRCPDRSSQPTTPAQAAAQKRFADIAAIVRRLRKDFPELDDKQLWKKAEQIYDAENH